MPTTFKPFTPNPATIRKPKGTLGKNEIMLRIQELKRVNKSLEDEIADLERRLQTVGDDSQLANIDLQNALQKQQQTIQMLSNISKLMHDTATGVIRNIR